MIEVSNSLSDELAACFGDRITITEGGTGIVTINVAVDDWQEVALVLRDDPRFAFSQLTDLCGVDYLSYGQEEWETADATRGGFSRGVEALGPGRFDSSSASAWLYT
jgi:NADH-quinone oxidoreductase subunit C